MIDLFGETEKPFTGEAFTGPTIGLAETAGRAVMRGGVRVAEAAALVAGALAPSDSNAPENLKDSPFYDPRVSPGDLNLTPAAVNKEDYFRFIDERLKPAADFWSPDPASLTSSGQVVSALFELPLQLAAGPAGLIATPALSTGRELVDEGVDPGTATAASVMTAGAMGAAVGMPAAGQTLKQTLGLIAANPVIGAAQDFATQELLEFRGYEEQAGMFDPFNPAARSVDLVLGALFGGLHEYARVRKTMPQEAVDAIDAVNLTKQREALSPFVATWNKPNRAAFEEALSAITEGRPVEVSRALEALIPKAPEPSYTAQRFREESKAAFGLTDEQADAALALVAARAKVTGENLDGYISKRIAEISSEMPAEESLLFQYPNISPEDARAAKGQVIERMARAVPDSDESVRLELMLNQYNKIIDGTAQYSDFQPEALFQGRPMVQPFYSKVLAEVENLQQEKWSGEQLLGKLRKTPGVKAEEMAWTGLDEFLAGKKSVTREEVRAFLDSNQVRVEEVVKGDLTRTNDLESQWKEANAQAVRLALRYAPEEEIAAARAKAQGIRDEINQLSERTKFGNYTLPGGENYREMLLTLPKRSSGFDASKIEIKRSAMSYTQRYAEIFYNGKSLGEFDDAGAPGKTKYTDQEWIETGRRLWEEGHQQLGLAGNDQANFKSGHYDEPNILAHVRFNERTGPAGERILHLEEVQSDWHQAGRSKGYQKEGGPIPDAPFAKSWHEQALRRMLRHAAENGFDLLTWTTGEQQAARYDLSKVMNVIRYDYEGDAYKVTGQTKDGNYQEFGIFRENQLEDAIGKDLAGRMIEARREGKQYSVYSGLDLKIGGEGMRGFYDKILSSYLAKFGKKFGAKPEAVEISNGERAALQKNLDDRLARYHQAESEVMRASWLSDIQDLERQLKALPEKTTVHSLPITDAMRDSLLYEGTPLFQGEKGAVSFLADGRAVIHALEAPDFSTLLHEIGHVFRRDLDKFELRELETWLLSKVPGGKWDVADEEKFARAFERYLAEGKAPSAELQGVFDKFKNWLLEIYQRITGTAIDVNLAPQVRAVFDRMLFTREMKMQAPPDVARARASVSREGAEMLDDLHKDLGLDPAEDLFAGAGNMIAAEIPTGPDAASGFLNNPENVSKVLAEMFEAEATALENSRAEQMAADGQALNAMVSDAAEWFLQKNRDLKDGGAVAKKSTVNALRKAAAGDFARLTPGQQEMVLAALDSLSRQAQSLVKEIDAQDLKVGDRFATPDLGQRVVVGERDGTLYLDNGQAVDLADTVQVLGEIDRRGRPENMPESAAEYYLQERGDFELYDGADSEGNPKMRSAREMIDEARADLAKAEAQEHLYKRAAFCLNLG